MVDRAWGAREPRERAGRRGGAEPHEPEVPQAIETGRCQEDLDLQSSGGEAAEDGAAQGARQDWWRTGVGVPEGRESPENERQHRGDLSLDQPTDPKQCNLTTPS